jgi:dTDP-4-dehydrorhamnose 3,5-epimerase
MRVIETDIPDVKILRPDIYSDERGYFLESYHKRELERLTGVELTFVQDNYSHSKKNVLRGLHYQIQQAQGKLISVINGEVFDVAVDLRESSPYFGCHASTLLTSKYHDHVWIPPGFAHGFMVLSDSAQFLYKTTDYYAPQYERTIIWNDPSLAIDWPIDAETAPVISEKDRNGLLFSDTEKYS